MIEISIIFGYRDRDTQRVKRCLDSLSQQSHQMFEAILVDYGSSAKFKSEINALADSYPFCKYVYNHTNGLPWNRSHALNSGLKIAKGKYILFGDIDFIYSSRVLATLLKTIAEKSQIHSHVCLLPEDFDDWLSLQNNPNHFKKTNPDGRGGCHFIEKKYLLELNGYDEYYCFWGVEDLDLSMRLEKMGIKTQWISSIDAPIYHQWHPAASVVQPGFFPERWWDDMNIHFQKNIDLLRRNNESWGKILEEEDRPIFKTTEQIELQIPKFGSPFVKLGVTKKILNALRELKPHQCLKLSLDHSFTYKANKSNILLSLLNKFLNKLLRLRVVASSEYEYLLSSSNDQNYYAERDVYYLIWTLIKKEKLIKDCMITNKQNLTEILFC